MIDHFLTTQISKLAIDKVAEQYKKEQDENLRVLKPPALIFMIGLAAVAFFGALLLACLFFVSDFSARLICSSILGCFILLGLFLIAYQKNFLLIYQNRTMIYRNLFRVMHTFDCHEIDHAFYTDSGGIKLVFSNGKTLHFSKEELPFVSHLLKCEHIKCQFTDSDNPIIKVSFHPWFLGILWFLSIGATLLVLFHPFFLLLGLFGLLMCLACHFYCTVYDKKSKLLTRRNFVFTKSYDMHLYSAKPFYEDDILTKINIYSGKKKVTSIPVSFEYKNRARLVWTLCNIRI